MPSPSRLQAHPWHGIPPGPDVPTVINCFIELVPTDTVKYEIDKDSGHLKLDRPQRFSSLCPTPYGFVPRTLCDRHVAAVAMAATGRTGIDGDGDPMDVCVLTERPINQGNLLVRARPIGGLRMLDHDQADDKIIAVLVDDPAYGRLTDVAQVPLPIVDRLRHYFLTYKEIPGAGGRPPVEITHVYDAATACDLIQRAIDDYDARFGT